MKPKIINITPPIITTNISRPPNVSKKSIKNLYSSPNIVRLLYKTIINETTAKIKIVYAENRDTIPYSIMDAKNKVNIEGIMIFILIIV
jgi:hypothetical protein